MADQNIIDNTQKDPNNWKSGDDPMTGAQKSYIETLSGGKESPKNLSKSDASKLIDRLRSQQK